MQSSFLELVVDEKQGLQLVLGFYQFLYGQLYRIRIVCLVYSVPLNFTSPTLRLTNLSCLKVKSGDIVVGQPLTFKQLRAVKCKVGGRKVMGHPVYIKICKGRSF